MAKKTPKVSTDTTMDLDQFLNLNPNSSTPKLSSIAKPNADRMSVVGIFVDDSGSMRYLCQPVLDGLALSVEAFRGAKGSDIYLDVRGFMRTYYSGMLRDLGDARSVFSYYFPDFRTTPLVAYTINHLRALHEKAEEYRNAGIPTTVSMLIMTDGRPENDDMSPKNFVSHIKQSDYIVGMGICGDNEEGRKLYANMFTEMGIKKVLLPTAIPSAIRHEMNQFSQSVAVIGDSTSFEAEKSAAAEKPKIDKKPDKKNAGKNREDWRI